MTLVKYEGKEYNEPNPNQPVMTEFTCDCGNPMYIPLGAIVLGLTDSCNHCTANHGYPKDRHCATITNGWIELIEDEEVVEL